MEITGLAREGREMRGAELGCAPPGSRCAGLGVPGVGGLRVSPIPGQSRTPMVESGELEWKKKEKGRNKKAHIFWHRDVF